MDTAAQEQVDVSDLIKDLSALHGQVVLIEWRDAHHDHLSDWMTVDQIEFPKTLIQSVGFLIKEDSDHIMLSTSQCERVEGEELMVCGLFTITKKQIIDIKRIQNDVDGAV